MRDYITPQCGCDIAHATISYCPAHQAAPDIYNALKAILAYFDSDELEDAADYLPAMRKALSKAEGR